MLTDSYERRINYARLSVTDLCNLRCLYCMPSSGVLKERHENILRVEEIVTLARILCDMGIDKIRITGGEPLVRKGIIDILYGINQNAKLKTLGITTNGVLLPHYIKDLSSVGVNLLNISLDSLNAEKYRWITQGADLKTVLSALESAVAMNFREIKINIVLIKDFNDDEVKDFVRLTVDMPIDVRFIELMPIGACANWTTNKYISNAHVLKTCNELVVQKEKIEKSSPASYYKLPNAKGRIGLISPLSCKFCQYCNRIRVTSDGKLKTCLHTDDETDLRTALRTKNYELVEQIIKNSINLKPFSHELESGRHIKRNMSKIGG